MKFFTTIIIILLFQQAVGANYHPTHMSVVNMNINTDSSVINYSIRLFQDDLNQLFSVLYHEELYHTNEEFELVKNIDKLVNYFNQSFKLEKESAPLKPNFISYTSNEEDFWLYFKVHLTTIPNHIIITNKILLDVNHNQTNLLIINYLNSEKGYSFNTEKLTQTIKLNNKIE